MGVDGDKVFRFIAENYLLIPCAKSSFEKAVPPASDAKSEPKDRNQSSAAWFTVIL